MVSFQKRLSGNCQNKFHKSCDYLWNSVNPSWNNLHINTGDFVPFHIYIGIIENVVGALAEPNDTVLFNGFLGLTIVNRSFIFLPSV